MNSLQSKSGKVILKIIAMICVWINNSAIYFRRDKAQSQAHTSLDGTGRCTPEASPLDIRWLEENIVFADYPHRLAHSLWRAQEFSLFYQHIHLLQHPVLDFGCGDGSFASVIFKDLDYGIDPDIEALAIAKDYNVYKWLGVSSGALGIEAQSIATVVSNSVLEHVLDIEAALANVHHILMPEGLFIFTVPTTQFTLDVARFYGKKESKKMDNQFYHRNLYSVNVWQHKLQQQGFVVERIIQYQPDWYTYMYRLLNTSGLGSVCFKLRKVLDRLFHKKIISWIKSSIENTDKGANVFIVARRER